MSVHRRRRILHVVKLGPFDFEGALPVELFYGGLQRGLSFRIYWMQ